MKATSLPQQNVKHSCKNGITYPNQSTDYNHCKTNNTSIGSELFLCGPRNFFHFALHFSDEFCRTATGLFFLFRQIYSHLQLDWNILERTIRLFGFLVQSMFLAELAVLFKFKSVWIILLVFIGPVVAVFAFRAGQR